MEARNARQEKRRWEGSGGFSVSAMTVRLFDGAGDDVVIGPPVIITRDRELCRYRDISLGEVERPDDEGTVAEDVEEMR